MIEPVNNLDDVTSLIAALNHISRFESSVCQQHRNNPCRLDFVSFGETLRVLKLDLRSVYFNRPDVNSVYKFVR